MTTPEENKSLIETRALTIEDGRSERPNQINPEWLKVEVEVDPVKITIPTLETPIKKRTGNPVFE